MQGIQKNNILLEPPMQVQQDNLKQYLLNDMGIKKGTQLPTALSESSTLTEILIYGSENKLFNMGNDIRLDRPVLSIPEGKHLKLPENFRVKEGVVLGGSVTFYHGHFKAAGATAIVYAKGNGEAEATVSGAKVHAIGKSAYVKATVHGAEEYPYVENNSSSDSSDDSSSESVEEYLAYGKPPSKYYASSDSSSSSSSSSSDSSDDSSSESVEEYLAYGKPPSKYYASSDSSSSSSSSSSYSSDDLEMVGKGVIKAAYPIPSPQTKSTTGNSEKYKSVSVNHSEQNNVQKNIDKKETISYLDPTKDYSSTYPEEPWLIDTKK